MLIFHLLSLLNRKKRVEITLGIVADFCPFCHTARPFKIKRIASKEPLSTGQGKLLDHEIECTVCGAHLQANPLIYEKFEPAKSHPRDMQALIRDTHPLFWSTHARRLAFEEQLRKSPDAVSPASRAQYMMELFALLNRPVTLCYKRDWRFDLQATVCLAATVVISSALIIASFTVFQQTPREEAAALASVCALIAGVLLTFVQLLLVPGRDFRNKLMPRLARGLAPFEPSSGELDALLAKCKAGGLLIGRKVKTDHLVVELEKLHAESAPSHAAHALQAPADLSQFAAMEAGRNAAANPAAERAKKIVEPFHLYNRLVEDFYTRSAHFDKPATIGCIGTGFCSGAIIAVALVWFTTPPFWGRLCAAAGCVFAAGAVYTIIQLSLAPARYTKKIALAKLVQALRPLNPTVDEINRALEKCKIAGLMIGKKVKPAQIMMALNATPTERAR